MLELLILGAIAAFLITRLFQVLGQRSGVENPDLAEAMSRHLAGEAVDDEPHPHSSDLPEPVLDTKLDQIVQKIKRIDPSFRVDWFIQGATQAFEMLIEAFSKERFDVLKKLMEEEIYITFENELHRRQEKHQTLETTLVKLDPPTIVDIQLDGTIALITVSFITEQINLLKSNTGTLVEGNPQQIEEITDQWIFRRDLSQDNPNWYVVEIKS